MVYLGYEIHLQSFTRICPFVVELCRNWVKMSTLNYGAFFIGFLYLFFSKYNLFRLQNTPTKFREESTQPSHDRSGDWLLDLAIDRHVRRLTNTTHFSTHTSQCCPSQRLTPDQAHLILAHSTRPAIVELCRNWMKISTLSFPVCFSLDFFNFFLLNTIYLGYEICLQIFVRIHPAVVELCRDWVIMSYLLFMVHFLSDSFTFFFC